ncbi:LysR substrate-binding domain protein [Bordetella bronchiseptica D993]|nr:LysR substrate-binding domain protein [Bordetella bronchiseptica D993]
MQRNDVVEIGQGRGVGGARARGASPALAPAVGLELAGVEGVKQAVRAGLGVGFVSIMSVRHEDGSLATLRLLPRPLTRTLSILAPHASAAARATQRFLDACLALP